MTKTVTLSDLIAKSNAFPLKFPVGTVRCSELQKRIPKSTLEAGVIQDFEKWRYTFLFLWYSFIV